MAVLISQHFAGLLYLVEMAEILALMELKGRALIPLRVSAAGCHRLVPVGPEGRAVLGSADPGLGTAVEEVVGIMAEVLARKVDVEVVARVRSLVSVSDLF